MSIGVPIKILHEAEGHVVTCETNTGEIYRGKLIEAEDNMNCQFASVGVTYRDGSKMQLENVYIRGSKIRFLILPDMLKNAPMFKKTQGRGGSAGRGKSAILRAQGSVDLSPYFGVPLVSGFIVMSALQLNNEGVIHREYRLCLFSIISNKLETRLYSCSCWWVLNRIFPIC